MSKELTAEGTPAADSVGPIPSLLSAAGLQAIYEDLVEQYQKAPDKKAREKLARRLVDDGRADDVETRALAVWAMVKLADPSFRRALSRAAADDSPEISKLALTGLERMGGIEP